MDFMSKVGNFPEIIILRSPETLVFLVKYHGLGMKKQESDTFPSHCQQKQQCLPKRAILAPKVDLWAPNAPFWVPCSKPFINVRFWEVFWGPRTGKVQLFT